jgi:hypothetical protein
MPLVACYECWGENRTVEAWNRRVEPTNTHELELLIARVDELEALVARIQEAPTATQERTRIGIWLRNQSYKTQWAGDLDFKKTAARIEAGEHWKNQDGDHD